MKHDSWRRSISIMALLIGAACWIAIIPITASQAQQTNAYFKSLGITCTPIQVTVAPGVIYDGLVFAPINVTSNANGTVPAIIHINGSNQRKEGDQAYTTTLARLGFEVFVFEQRGHGQSTGHNTFYALEPFDISHLIDYIGANYPEVNATHIGVSGFSLGAGLMLLAQAMDPRIYCSVLYAPPTNFTALLSQYDLNQWFGTAFFGHVNYTSPTLLPMADRSPTNYCNSSNTKNLLILQGANDTEVTPTTAIAFFNKVNPNPANRTDIQLILRPGLNHVPNQNDPTSRLYAEAWFLHYFKNSSIDITNLTNAIQYMQSYTFNPPTDPYSVSDLAIIGMIALEIPIFIWIISPIWKKEKKFELTKEPFQIPAQLLNPYVLQRGLIIIASSIFIGGLVWAIDPNIVFGIFLYIPLVSLIAMKIHRSWFLRKNGLIPPETKNDRLHYFLRNAGITILLLIPIVIGVLIHDENAILTVQSPWWPWKEELFVYAGLTVLITYWAYCCFEDLSVKNVQQWLILFGLIILGTWIYSWWNPIPNLSIVPNTPLLLIIATGIAALLVGFVIKVLGKIFTHPLIPGIFLGFIVAIIVLDHYMAIFI